MNNLKGKMVTWWWLDWLVVALTLALAAMGASVIGHLLSPHRPSRAHSWVRLAGLVLMGVGEMVLVQHIVCILTGRFTEVLDFALGRVFGLVCPLLLVHACCGYSRCDSEVYARESETRPGASVAERSGHSHSRKMGNVAIGQLGVSSTEGNTPLLNTATVIMHKGPLTDADRIGPAHGRARAHCGRRRPEGLLLTGKRSTTQGGSIAVFLSVYLWTVAVVLSSATILSLALSASDTLACRQDVDLTVYTWSSHSRKWIAEISQDHLPLFGAHAKIIARPIFDRLKDGDEEWIPKTDLNQEHSPLMDSALGQQMIGLQKSHEQIGDVRTTEQASEGGTWAVLLLDSSNTSTETGYIPDYLGELLSRSVRSVAFPQRGSNSVTEILLYFLYFVPLAIYWAVLTICDLEQAQQTAGGELEDCQETVRDLNPSIDTFSTEFKTCSDLLSSEVAGKNGFTSGNTSNKDFTFSATDVSPMNVQNTTKCSQAQKQAPNNGSCSPSQLTSKDNPSPKQVTNMAKCSQLKVHIMSDRSPRSDIFAGSNSSLMAHAPRSTAIDAGNSLTLADNNPVPDKEGPTKADMSVCTQNIAKQIGHGQEAESVGTALQTTCRLHRNFNKLSVPLNTQTDSGEQELYVIVESESGCGMCQQLSHYMMLAACVMIIQPLVCWPVWGSVTWFSEGELYMIPTEFTFLPAFSALSFVFWAIAREMRAHE